MSSVPVGDASMGALCDTGLGAMNFQVNSPSLLGEAGSAIVSSEDTSRPRRGRRRHSSSTGRGSVKALLEENQKLRQELDASENQIAEFQAQMPSLYDDMEKKINKISHLENALELSQNKYKLLNERQKKMELTLNWTDQDMQEQLNLISTENSAEVEGMKNRMFQQINKLSQELSIENHERNVLVNDLVLVKKQLAKLRKDRDDEREVYLLNTAELERVSRVATKEKNKYRIAVEEMREHIFGLESELENQKELVAEKEQLLQTQREELRRVDSDHAGFDRSASVTATILTGNLAVELSHNENLISNYRQQKINAEEDLADCREHLENTLTLMEYAVGAVVPDRESGDGVFQLEKAIADTRYWLGLEPILEEESELDVQFMKPPETFDDVNLDIEDLILERKEIGTGLDEVDLGSLSVKKPNIPELANEVPVLEPNSSPNFAQMEEFKQEVVKEVSKMKQVILEEFKQLAQLRTSVVDEQLMDTIQNSTQDSAKAVIDWIERDRRNTLAVDNASDIERLRTASRRSLEDQQNKMKMIVERLREKVAGLETALKTANSETETLREQRQKDEIERLRVKADLEKKTVNFKMGMHESAPTLLNERAPTVRLHRLETMAGLSTNQKRKFVTSFLMTYSTASKWQTHRDPKLHTTIYMFEFHGSMWKTRISFLYPFVNYMSQVIGVNKKALGSVFIILPTSTVAIKIHHLSSSFHQMRKTLEKHNSDSLWNYIFIFLKNVSTHYAHIMRYVGSRTTINTHDNRGRSATHAGYYGQSQRSMRGSSQRSMRGNSSQYSFSATELESKQQGL